MNRFLDAFADLVTGRRALMLGIIGVITVGLGVWIPQLVADPTPQQLTASSVQNQAQISADFNARFGNPDHVVVLLVEAEDVLAPEPLGYVHRLARAFQDEVYVDRVDGVTVTPFALPAAPEEVGLDDLDDAPSLDDLDDEDLEGLDALEDAPDDDSIDPELEDALGVLVQTSPERFPMGLGSIASRMADVQYGAAIEGDEVTDAERERLIAAIDAAPLLEGRLISRDRTLTVVALALDERVEDHRVMQETVEDIDAWLEANPPPRGVNVYRGGLPHLFNSIVVKMADDNVRIVPLTLLVCLVLLFVSFRWVPGTFLPVVAVGLSAIMVIGAMALAGETMNVINNIIPPLLIIIGVSDSIHLIGRYREELDHASSKMEAARNTAATAASSPRDSASATITAQDLAYSPSAATSSPDRSRAELWPSPAMLSRISQPMSTTCSGITRWKKSCGRKWTLPRGGAADRTSVTSAAACGAPPPNSHIATACLPGAFQC